MKNRMSVLVAILVLAFIGIADASYLTQHAYEGIPLNCTIGGGLDGCNIVAQSVYSKLFGIPLALYGIGFYILTFILAALALVLMYPLVERSLRIVAGAGAAASAVFIFIQLVLIQAICVYCFLSAAVSFLIFWLAMGLRVTTYVSKEPVIVPWGPV